jgi:hypothetical protein
METDSESNNAPPTRKNNSIWSKDIENILDSIRQNSIVMNEEHKKRYIMLEGRLRYFRLPIIIISGINSVVSIGFQAYLGQQTISVVTCLLSLGCGIISSIELYLAIQRQMESELLACKDFYLISTRIFTTLSLNIENRKIDGMDFFEEIFSEYTNLMQKSIIIADKIDDKLIPIDDIYHVKYTRSQYIRNFVKYGFEKLKDKPKLNDLEQNKRDKTVDVKQDSEIYMYDIETSDK